VHNKGLPVDSNETRRKLPSKRHKNNRFSTIKTEKEEALPKGEFAHGCLEENNRNAKPRQPLR
jgi:hypothetical protein